MLRSNLASSEIASEASLRNYIDRLWVNNQALALMSFPMRWVVKATSVTATEFYGSVIRAIFMFRWIRLSVTRKTHLEQFYGSAIISLFTICHVKKLACFCEPQFGRISLNISPPHSVLETEKVHAKVLHSTCQTIKVCKQLQSVDFDGTQEVLPCSSRFLRALQQNRAQSRLLYLLSITQPRRFHGKINGIIQFADFWVYYTACWFKRKSCEL